MKTRILLTLTAALALSLSGCKTEECTVKGTVQGVRDGAELELTDEWNKFKTISSTTVENGTFEFHPRFKAPTHVYLYAKDPKDVIANPYDGGQLKDFILEPGTIVVEVDAADEEDMYTGAKGTLLNDTYQKIHSADADARETLWEEVTTDERTKLLALLYADDLSFDTPLRALDVLDNLSPEMAKTYKKYISTLRKRCARNLKAEERRKNSEQSSEEDNPGPQYYIDMEYPGPDGKSVSLSSVVNDPANRYVILDFWATWCGPCVKSIPELREIYAKYHDKGLEIFSVSQDTKAKAWKSFLPENDMTWVNVLAPLGRVYKNYAIQVIPTVFLIDCQTGEILLHDHHPDWDAILSGLLPEE